MLKKTGLILTGGGARAAYQVGVLQAVAEMRRDVVPPTGALPPNPFSVICGTSAGAINAASLACGADDFDNTVAQLIDIWQNVRVDQVYQAKNSDMIASGARWLSLLSLGWIFAHKKLRPRSLLDNQPLMGLLSQHVRLDRLPSMLAQGHLDALAITASCYTTGEHVTFYDSHGEITPWVRNQRMAQRCQIDHSHLLASSAIPFVFPATPLNGPQGRTYFGDGSMRQMAPISPVIHLGAERVFVIGAGRRGEPTAPRQGEAPYPSIANIAGHALSSIFLDTLAVDIERTRRINQTLALIPPQRRPESNLRHIELLVISPSQRIDDIAVRHASALPATVSSLLRILGASGSGRGNQGGALVSYLLFEAAFTQELIALGHADAVAQRDEIHRFFHWPSAASPA
ncbi:MAG: patatin-like phospholipase family protein [Burkholderiaceae bacterium]|nr:patatin-like phospholipase family protein [Burkholderiaceae bacterium]